MKRILIAVLFTTLLGLALFLPPITHAAEDSDSFVTRTGTKFYLNGNEFKFVGFNLFDAMGAGDSPYSCVQSNGWWTKYSDDELDSAMRYMRTEAGATVLRVWAFPNYTKGATDYSGFDKLIRLAKKNGLKIMPVLENGQEHCTGDDNTRKYYEESAWYKNGYKSPWKGQRLSYRDYVREVVTHYKDEPVIFGWMMMNEADTSAQVDGKSILVQFGKDIGGLIKSIDSKHLVTIGTQSSGGSGASGTDFIAVYGLPEIDFTEAHDWWFWAPNEDGTLALPGSPDGINLPDVNSAACKSQYPDAKVGCSLAMSVQVLNKPFVMGEGGAKAEDNPAARQTRATIMDNKMRAVFDNGGAGYLIWQFNKKIDGEKFDVLQSHNDPLIAKMKARAGYQFALPGETPSVTPTTEPTEQPNACGRADINQDRKINILDYTILVANIGRDQFDPKADINLDNKVNLPDYTILMASLADDC